MFKPLTHRVVIDPIYDSDYYNPQSQLIKIPEFAKDRCDQGTIYAIGPDCDPMLKIGMHVIFSGYTGSTIGIDNHVYILMHHEFIKGYFSIEDNPSVSGMYFKSNNISMFEARYNEVIHILNDDYSRRNVKIKPDTNKQQRDPIDERSR